MSSAETYYGLIETSEDAIILFEACRLGIRRRVQRRLTDTERMSIRSGSVFVWDEDESGMRRWTDGRSWSPSRVQGCFLTYCEWEGRRRATIRRPNLEVTLLPFGDAATGPPAYVPRYSQPARQSTCQIQQGCAKENGILKKALSLTTTDGRKLHLIAYYYKQDLDIPNRLLTPSTDP
ncbi:Gluconate transport-inducing protein, partial [Spiromyces aspiralis]